MPWEWAPGVAVGALGGILVWWRGSAVLEQRFADFIVLAEQKATAARETTDQKFSSLESQLKRHEAENVELREVISTELRESYERLNGIFTEMKIAAAEQAAFNRICTTTLEGIAKKLEYHDAAIVQHQTSIEVLKVRSGFSE